MARRAAPQAPEPDDPMAAPAPDAALDAATSATPHERLATYRAKRDFSVTAEPSGAVSSRPVPPSGTSRFVVQRHRARRLHYDLRLEMGGVLVSWAVPRGPTLDPSARHMAIHVEDHPLEYFDFEGVIPAGEYGGGDVIVWDWGTWTPAGTDDPLRAVADGELHADLEGEKLHGRFVLVRTDGRRRGASTGRPGRSGGKDEWLLLHKRDDAAVAGWDPEEHPHSVKTGRTNDEVLAAADADRWTTEGLQRGSWAGPTDTELAALDALGRQGDWEIDGRVVRLTNLDKVLFPGDERRGRPAATKRDLVRHLTCVAPVMMPYLAGRPVNLHRYPDGAGRKGFWHKSVPDHAPDWLQRWRNEEADPGETEWYLVPDGAASLAWLANFGALELHPWTSTTAHPHQPTWAMIDIDPGERTTFDDVLVLARLYRSALDHLGVEGRPKVTGRRGVQIFVPVADGTSFDETRGWVETISRAIGATVPELVSWAWRKDERGGLARLDFTQNAINRTLVAPFSPRAAAGAPVSVTLEWHELDDPDLRPDRYAIADVPARLAAHGDPLRPLVGRQQRLPALS